MNGKILSFFRGYLIVKITGNALERFINQIVDLGISLSNVQRIDKNCYKVKMKIRDYKKLRPIVRKRKCKVSIIEKKGLVFKLKTLMKNKFLMFSFILMILLFWFSSQFIWMIQIKGDDINQHIIYEYLRENNVKRGSWKNSININQLEKKMISEFEEFNWVYIYWSGSKLVLDIVKKNNINSDINKDLIAQNDSKITEIILMQGIPLIKEGDYVTKGQKLILGEKMNNKIVPARAIVKGEVWYDFTVSSDLVDKIIFAYSTAKKRYGIKFNNKVIYFSPLKHDFKYYLRQFERKRIFKWRNNGVTIEIIKEKVVEISERQSKKSLQSVIFETKEKAIMEVLNKLNTGDIIKEIYIKEHKYDKADKQITTTIYVKVNESIID